MKNMSLIFGIFFLFITVVHGQENSLKAKAGLYNPQGEKVGETILVGTPHGVLITTELWNLPSGAHAFHIHTVGKCEPPFKSAAGHFNPFGKKHGIMNPEGKHAGDLPNVHIGADGNLKLEVLANEVTLGKGVNSLFDADGSAIVIHAGPDDYKSDPAGNAGPRIACGVIVK
jgi:Cu-Zn family superoxide dismutase